jgi:mRNA interferase MazF
VEKFVKGDVVVVLFPFTDKSSSKKRPALVAANPKGDDLILCAITSKNSYGCCSVELGGMDFLRQGLKIKSYVKLNKIFTMEKSLILYKVDSLKEEKIKEIEKSIVKMFLA